MTETEPTTEQFKPQLLYINDVQKTKLINDYYSNIEHKNALILECETLLKRPLTKKENNALLKNAIEFSESVKTLIRDSFQFTNASEDFNLNALGLSFDKLEIAVNNIQDNDYKYLISEGKVIAEPKQIIAIDDQCKIFTANHKQNQVFEVAKSLKESASKLKDLGIIYGGSSLFDYSKATDFLIQVGTGFSLNINYNKILSLH